MVLERGGARNPNSNSLGPGWLWVLLVTAEMPQGDSGPSGPQGGARGLSEDCRSSSGPRLRHLDSKVHFQTAPEVWCPVCLTGHRHPEWQDWDSSAITLGCTLLVRLPPVTSLHILSGVSQSLAPVPYSPVASFPTRTLSPRCFEDMLFRNCPRARGRCSCFLTHCISRCHSSRWLHRGGLAPASRCPDPVCKADRLRPHV